MREVRIALSICRLLADQELSLHDVASRLDINHRTARRYIYALTLSGLDILVRKPRRSYGKAFYRLDRRSWHGLLYLPRD